MGKLLKYIFFHCQSNLTINTLYYFYSFHILTKDRRRKENAIMKGE